MKNAFILVLSAGIFSACTRDADPRMDIVDSYSFRFSNVQDQRRLAGSDLGEALVFNVTDLTGKPAPHVNVQFSVLRGGGTLSVNSEWTDNTGTVSTGWKLGSASCRQTIKASAFDQEGHFLTSSYFNAYGFRTNVWDTISTPPETNIWDIVADTVNHFSLMIANSNLYRQGANYFTWEVFEDLSSAEPRSIDIDGNGVLYLGTWKGEILKSTDHGNTWFSCTKPYADNFYYLTLFVSNDNYLWTYKQGYPTQYSSDGGQTWQQAGPEFSSAGFDVVYRMKDGSLIYHGSDCCSLKRSTDYGATATPLQVPGSSVKLFVDPDDNILVCTQENGNTIYRSSDMGATFEAVSHVYPEFSTQMGNIFNRWSDFYYVVVPGYGIFKSADLINYELYREDSDIKSLFVDHNGVLMACDLSSGKVYYRKNTLE